MTSEKAQSGMPSQSPRPGAAASSDALPPALRDCLNPHKPGRSNPRYLEFVRSRACSFCAKPVVDPHHAIKRLRGISEAGLRQKGSDCLCIPACRKCHEKMHNGVLKPDLAEILELIVINLVCFIDENRERLL